MKSFRREFLNEDWAALPEAPRVYLAAFGKHPGWNDHMDDLGLVTESLVEAKRCLYVQGVSSQIESGAWDRLGAEKALGVIDHTFLWHRPGESLAGLIWSSRDGAGRTLYPMILCAHLVAPALDWVWSEVLPRLELAAESCRQSAGREGVIGAMNAAQEALRRGFRGGPSAAASPLDRRSDVGVAGWTAHFGREPEALRRVCHHLARDLPGADGANNEAAGSGFRSSSLRLPQVPRAGAAESLNAWLRFLHGQFDPFWPVLLLKPRAGDWLDAIFGEPGRDDFFRLRALPAAEPIVSTIPYTLAAGFARQVDGLWADVQAGRMPRGSILNGKTERALLDAAAQRLRREHRRGAAGFLHRLLNLE